MAKPLTWGEQRARDIESRLRSRYGKEWRTLVGPEIAERIIESEVLNLVMTQALGKYEPAQTLVRKVLDAFDERSS